jgi:hypothetical protein
MNHARTRLGLRIFLSVITVAALLGPMLHSAAGALPKALINGDTVVASSDLPPKSDEQIQAEAAGFDVTVVSGATWQTMSETQFRAYDVLIIGDPDCSAIAPSVMANLTTWTDAVMHSGGNRIVVGSDPVFHSGRDSTNARNHIILDGITFAGAEAGATGAYVDTSCDASSKNVSILNELSQSGTGWSVQSPGCAGNIGIVGSHPLMTHTTDADLSNWGCSSHSAYPTWADDWVPFAISADAPTKNTCAKDVETDKEVCGEPYILFSGRGTSISSKLTLSPSSSTNPAGSDHTVTATIDNPTLAGKTVSFSISSGPNAGKTGSCVTDGSGKCTFTYHDDGGVGTDTIVAEFTDDGGRVQQATASKTWEASQATACVQPPANMRAWWTFDETAGTSAADIAALANTGTHTNGPTPGAGQVAGALGFDGVNDHVSTPNHSELLFGRGSLSIDAWIRTSKANGSQPIVDKRVQQSNGKAQGYTLFLQNGKLAFQLANGTRTPGGFFNYFSTNPVVADGRWHHVAATVRRPSSAALVLYVDGVSVKSVAGTSVLAGSLNEKGPLWIGRRRPVPSGPYANAHFKGMIDEVEIFSRALSASEVQSLYSAGPSGKCKPTTAPPTLTDVPNVDEGIATGDKTCPSQPYFRYVGGDPDNFAAPADTSYAGTNLTAYMGTFANAHAHYDTTTPDLIFGESFNLEDKRKVCYAMLQMGLDELNGLASNDTLSIGRASAGPPRTFSPSAGQVTRPGAPGPGPVTRTWAFSAAGLTALSTITGSANPNDSVLDIFMQDDTAIDYMTLWVWYHP